MNLFEVYSLWNIEPVKAEGCKLWDKNGTEYLDFYGGHAVISIGHSHHEYVKAIEKQVENLGFYSNADYYLYYIYLLDCNLIFYFSDN